MSLPEAPPVPYLLALPQFGDARTGFTTAAPEAGLPFVVARTYWTYHTPDTVVRGHHAHRTLQQLLFAVQGRLEVDLESADGQCFSFSLTQPNIGLYVPGPYWRTIRFRERGVLLCLASEPYNEASYLRDYAAFRALAPAP